MSMHTTGRVALVTGANKGIGRAAAERLAGLGMTVLVGSRDARRGREAAAAVRASGVRASGVRASGGDAHAVALDVTDPAVVREAAAWIGERFGRLDVLVNNAGITGSGGCSPRTPWTRSRAPWTWTWSGRCSRPTCSG